MNLPTDLGIAIAANITISLGLAYGGYRANGRLGIALAMAGVVVLILHAVWLADNLILARVLPVANVMAWANVQTPAVGLVTGVALRRLTGPTWQRVLVIGGLVGVGIWRLTAPYAGSPPLVREPRWINGICLQSTTSTCSAAAGATLLAAHGISTTEADMCDVCLTRENGTTRPLSRADDES